MEKCPVAFLLKVCLLSLSLSRSVWLITLHLSAGDRLGLKKVIAVRQVLCGKNSMDGRVSKGG